MHENITSIGDHFCSSTSIKELTIPDSVKSIGNYFGYNYNAPLRKIRIPAHITELAERFITNAAITEVIIPKAVNTINRYFCSGCYNLEKIVVCGDITTMPYNIENADCLNTVIFYSKTAPASDILGRFGYSKRNIRMYVPDDALEDYRAVATWSWDDHREQVRPLSEYKGELPEAY